MTNACGLEFFDHDLSSLCLPLSQSPKKLPIPRYPFPGPTYYLGVVLVFLPFTRQKKESKKRNHSQVRRDGIPRCIIDAHNALFAQ